MLIDADGWIGLRQDLYDTFKQIGRETREAVNEGTLGLKAELRRQVMDAGFGNRLANTWQSILYKKDKEGLDTAGYVFSKAPDIVFSFTTGATIAPLGGKRFLWVPTRSVPRAVSSGRKSNTKRMTPAEVERYFRQPLIVRPGRSGRMYAFIVKDRGVTKSGKLRNVRKGRLGQGDGELVLMFNLLPTTRRMRLFDIDAAAKVWADRIVKSIT